MSHANENYNNKKIIFYLEKLKNIKTLLVIVNIQNLIENKKNVRYDVRANSNSIHIKIFNLQQEIHKLDIPLPLHCRINQNTLHCQQDVNSTDSYSLEIKATLLIDLSDPLQSSSATLLDDVIDDHHLTALDNTDTLKQHLNTTDSGDNSVYCRQCLNRLLKDSVNKDKKYIIKLLPSSNWVEMMDVWLCGCTGVTSFNGFPTGDINALVDYYFIGDRFVLVHNDNVNTEDLVIGSKSKEKVLVGPDYLNQEWNIVQCKMCYSTVGLNQVQENLSYNYRLFKHAITTTLSPPQSFKNYSLSNVSNLYDLYTLETYISTQILLASRSSITFKFSLTCLHSKQVFAIISLIHWETLFYSNYYSNDSSVNTNTDEFKPILKVLYHQIQDDKNDRDIVREWESNYQIKHLYLPPEDCKVVIDLLNSSNNIFPNHRKHLEQSKINFKIGILRLKI
ncbi:hypothetical protein DLAC_05012 [Tieghemostelium lacteum]|uniref:Ubiquitin-conjugating enzyme E2C-binding protein n=1 Tax=Tieghemostelium lacteum TaxID=361077 RepID=A0A151ZIC4_TIELA|nr:hypothetical protein DLAC_05012 [Tieghemostelium lacteum]|eukprot:KYQ93630.1 hypothetical protein DLAC_05012 [Tieghemostelium lacteum]